MGRGVASAEGTALLMFVRTTRRGGALLALSSASVIAALTAIGAPGLASPASSAIAASPAWAQSPQWFHVLDDSGGPVAESSPNLAILDGAGPSVVVGDRAGFVYGFHLADGSPVPGWPVNAGAPVDSTPSAVGLGGSDQDSVFVGSGNASNPTVGGYEGFGPTGRSLWRASVVDPSGDAAPAYGVQASLSVGSLQGGTDVVAASLGQEEYALNATTGASLAGWPFFTSDSNFSTAALADLYGTGQTEVVQGGDQSAGFALGQNYPQGGHLRILNARGGLICHYDTNQTVDSSPAVGGFLGGGTTGIAMGTGSFFEGASDTDTVLAFDPECNLRWSASLDGSTFSSPALADVMGNGTLDVVEGTDSGSGGSVWVLNGTNGQAMWHAAVGRVIGSVVTADLFHSGHQDLLVPTTSGVKILDGRSGTEIAAINAAPGDVNGIIGFQNSPLVTNDTNGTIGITLAGYDGRNQGVVEHFEIPGSKGTDATAPGAWPMFHHDPQLTGNAGGTPAAGSVAACSIPDAALAGYDLVAADGGIFSFGGQPFCGSTGGTRLNAPIVGMAMSPNTGGYWLVASDGGIFAYGGAHFYGSTGGLKLNKPIVGMAVTPDGRGYWLVASDGGIFAFGDAPYYGSTGGLKLNHPVVGMAAAADGLGYRLATSDGGIFTFGDAHFLGSMGGQNLAEPIVGMADDTATGGYWLVASDGGLFAFNAPFYGSMGGRQLSDPIVAMQVGSNGDGYRFVASDGGVFAFGDASFAGSMGGRELNKPVVGVTGF